MIASKSNKHKYYYCNQNCRSEHLKILMLGENNPNYEKVDHHCNGCDKLIKIIPSKIKNQEYIFCSNECYKNNIGKFYTGKYNHNYNQQEYSCNHCCDNKGGNIVAHHILNYSEHKELRIDIDNGITLCKVCHVLFHNIYGYTNNNEQQLIEFIENHKKEMGTNQKLTSK